MSTYLISHDLGTSGDKATLFTTDGKMVKSRTTPYNVQFKQKNYAEQNPEDWWKAVCESTRDILDGVEPGSIAAISFSAQMQCCLPVDKDGNALRPAMIWADQRAVEEAEHLEREVGFDKIYDITGHRVNPAYSIEKLMWLKKHEPDVYGKTEKMLHVKDYIIYKLTGEFVTDYSDASGTNALDLKKLIWSEEILEAAGISKSVFPELKNSTDYAGYVTKEAANLTGLPKGLPVICGGGDGPCAAVGAGCIHENQLFSSFGTSAWIGGTTKDVFTDDQRTLFCFAHVIPGYYMPCGTMQAAGSSYSYMKNTFFQEEAKKAKEEGKSPYEILNKMIENSPPGAKNLIFLPYMLGERCPRWNSNASGSFLGMRMYHEKQDYLRAVIEGVAYNLEVILQAYRRKMPVEEMILTGGGAKGAVVEQILADVLNVNMRRPDYVEEATSIAAAVIGGIGVGVFKDFEAVHTFLKFENPVLPIEKNKKTYEKLKKVFEDSYHALTGIYEEMAEI